MKIKIEEINESPFNVRKEYELDSLDISEGIVQKPIMIKRENYYEIVVGHRRIKKAIEEGLKEVECEVIGKIDNKEILKRQARENIQRKEWKPIEEANHFNIQLANGISKAGIVKNIGKSERYVEQRLVVLEQLDEGLANSVRYPTHNPKIDRYSLTFRKAWLLATNLSKNDQVILAEMIKEEGLSTEQVSNKINNAKKTLSRLELLETTHPEVTKRVKEYWYPLRFRNVYDLMEEEIGIRICQPRRTEYFLPTEQYTEEQAREYADKQQGQYLEIVTKSWHRIYIIPNTIEQLRKKGEDRK